MTRTLFLALAVILWGGAALAAPPSWVLDRAASSIRFSSSMGGEAFSGTFRKWDAVILFDPANLAGSSVIATIDTASASTGNADRDQALPTPTFFNSPAFPRATFVAHNFAAVGPGRYVANGVLTLRGVGKPLALPFTLAMSGPVGRMTATVAINRLAFGVGQDEWKAVTTIPAAVTVQIAITAHRPS